MFNCMAARPKYMGGHGDLVVEVCGGEMQEIDLILPGGQRVEKRNMGTRKVVNFWACSKCKTVVMDNQ